VTPKLATRLAMDLAAGALLLLGLAYYWLDNTTPELAGTAMFALLFAHNLINRRWYRSVPRRQDTRRTLDKVLVFALLAGMVTLLITSVMISQTVFAAVASPDAFTARRLHLLAAYWVLLLVALHVGIRWQRVLGFLGVTQKYAGGALRWLARLAAVALAVAGIYSSYALGIGDKLLSRMSLDSWDFSVAPYTFFLHHIAIVGLYAVVANQVWRRLASRGYSW